MNFDESSNESLSDSGGDFPVRAPNMRRSTSDRHLPVRERSSPVFRPTSTPVDKLLFSEDEAGTVREIHTTAHEDAATTNSLEASLVDATEEAGPRPCARAGRRLFASGPRGDERVFQQGEDLAPSPKVRLFNVVASSSSSSSSDEKSRPVRPQPTTTTLTIDSSSVNSKEMQPTSSLGSETAIDRAHGTGSSLAADLNDGSFSSVSPSASAVVQSAIEARESGVPSTEELVSLPAHVPNSFADRFSLSHNSATFDMSPKVDAIAPTASQALGTGGNRSSAEEVGAHEDAASAIPFESEEKWSQLLAESTRLASAASFTATHATAVGTEEDDDVEEGLLKVMTVLQIVNESSRKLERPLLQNYVRRMAHDMISTQMTLADAGLMPYVGCSQPEAVLSRGVFELHVDSSCRLFAVLDVEQCTVSLRDILAFHITPLTERELVAVIKVTTRRLAALHAAGFVHGALHVGNILFSTVDGHCTLTQPMGVASNLLFPADMSSLSPNRARRLAPHVQRVWGPNAGRQLGRLGNPQPVDAGEQLAAFILGLLSEEVESAGELPAQFGGISITPADDIFALGALTVSLLLGLPVFYGSTLHETVEVLSGTPTSVNGSTNGEEVDRGTRFFSKEFHCPYAQLRFHQAGYSETFVVALSSFVADCLRSCFLSDDVGSPPEAIYADADALLAHPLFTEFFPEDENEDVAQDTLHRVAYPVSVGLQNTAAQCGTTPYVAQLHANSIFSSRRSALADDYNSSQRSCAAELHGDLTSAQWPLLNRRCSGWLPLCPSVTSYDPFTYRDTTANLHTVGETGWGFWFPFHAQLQSLRSAGIPNSMQQEAVELKCDCRILPQLHTILFDNRVNATLLMGNADVAPWREAVDILVLRNLTSCRIQILTHFRYVVMHNLRGCEVLLGPCHTALIQSVEDCSPIALAGTHLLLDDVSRVHLQFSGSSRPTMALGREYTVREIDLEPYGVVYPGLSMDYSAVALPQEHAAVFLAPNTTATSVALQRPVKLLEIEPQTHDIPYSHALPAFGYCFMHCDDNESDVYMYCGELHGKDAHILNIHGGGDQPPHAESHLYSTDTQLSARHLGSDGQQHCSYDAEDSPITSTPRYPVIFILDAVQDVIIRDCSYCTVFVLGATGSVVVEHCHNMRIFFMTKEATVEDCFAVTMFAFVTEYIMVANSFYMDIWPLYVKCPYVDAILHAIVDGCIVEDTEDGETVRQAYETRRMNLLNVVLQEGGRQVITTECNDTLVLHDAAWLRANESEKPYMISIAVPAVELESTTVPEGYAGTCVSECTFFESCCSAMGISIEDDFRHVRFGDLLYSPTTDMEATQLLRDTDVVGPRAMTIVRIHDLLDTSVLRIPGALHLRPDSQVTGRGVPETADAGMRLEVAADLILERLVLGEAHFVEAVGCLIIRNCAGPLDIAVCAAKRVVMEGCTNVVLRTACISFSARDCHNCHVALHVNTPPCYLRCSGMVASALNLAAHNMERLLSCVGVKLDLNAFEKILLLPARAADVGDSSAECIDDHREPTLHSYCGGTREDSSDPHSEPHSSGGAHAKYDTSTKMPLWETPPIANMMEAFEVLRRPVTIVPPLDHMVIGLEDAESLEKLEQRVQWDESRMPLEEQLMAALSYVATANLQTHEVNATQHSQELPALQQTCAKGEDLGPKSNKAREPDAHTPTEGEFHRPPHRFIPAPAPSSLEISENPVILKEVSGVESSEDDGPAIPMQMAVPRETHLGKSALPLSLPPFLESTMTEWEVPAVSLMGPRRTPLQPPMQTPTKVAGLHDQEDHPLSRKTSAVSSASVEKGTVAVQPAAGFGASVLPQPLSAHPTFSLLAPPVPTGYSIPKAHALDLGGDYSSEEDSHSASGAKTSLDALVTTRRSGANDVLERDPSLPESVPETPINTSLTPVKGYPVQAADSTESLTLNAGQASTPRSCREEGEEEEKKLTAMGTAERSAGTTVGGNPPLGLCHHMDPTAGPTASADNAVQVSGTQPPTSFAVREFREILRATRQAYVPLTAEGEQQLAEQVAKAIAKVKLWAAES